MESSISEEVDTPNTRWWLIVFFAVLILWSGLTWLVLTHNKGDPKEAGPFGDMFGAVNALFTGLAFAGVVCTLHLQVKQAENSRRQAVRTARDESETREAFNKATYAAAFKTASEILQSADAREARRIVITGIGSLPLQSWTGPQLAAAEVVCHTYNEAGMLVRYGLLPARYLADGWGDSLRRCWDICQPLIQRYRVERGSFEFWDDFEFLALEAKQRHQKEPRTLDAGPDA